jgi:hypothetical protein
LRGVVVVVVVSAIAGISPSGFGPDKDLSLLDGDAAIEHLFVHLSWTAVTQTSGLCEPAS